jgi:hypothetical protein
MYSQDTCITKQGSVVHREGKGTKAKKQAHKKQKKNTEVSICHWKKYMRIMKRQCNRWNIKILTDFAYEQDEEPHLATQTKVDKHGKAIVIAHTYDVEMEMKKPGYLYNMIRVLLLEKYQVTQVLD